MRKYLLAAPLLLASAGAFASQTNTAVNNAQFLQLGAGARSLGMGEAFGPVAEGPEALYWNPAGLAQMRSPESAYTHMELYNILHYDYVAHAQPVKWLGGTLGFSFTRLAQDSLPVVSNSNQQVASFTPQSNAFTVGFARAFNFEGSEDKDRDYFRDAWETPGAQRPFEAQRQAWEGTFMAGLALKGISESLYDHSANAVALDGGVLFRPSILQQLSLSATFSNAFGQEKFDQQNFLLPVQFAVGAAYDARAWDSRLLPAVELVMPYFGSPYVRTGVEYTKSISKESAVAMRMGFKSLTASDISPLSTLTFGVGVQYKKMNVDFGYEPMADLGGIYRATVGWRW